ncbi:hypothetical protein LINGRAHAP2_LOCUS14716 [Linum grandiflorum]
MGDLLGSDFDASKNKSLQPRPKADNILSEKGRTLQ